ncbi:GNAT family N-acetyltransferase [Ferrimonas marina]|uniref:Ribosomal protein S18 acetylase RimI n=1 Tax=Ferrimonas marina TaxID=299255 RepID=A0A1M5U4X0_9GAMM|nr:GNAT family N-acetyltransferase [Ferrimonas marina]SHH57906.1 Ribosomal protein S18 acetylase RimI [Ferrimonas marina]
MKVRLREASAKDAAAIVEINNSHMKGDRDTGFLVKPLATHTLKKALRLGNATYFVAEVNQSDIIGFVQISGAIEKAVVRSIHWDNQIQYENFQTRKYRCIEKIAVRKEYGKHGIGSLIMNEVSQLFKGFTLYSFIVVKPITNSPSIRLHEKMGFESAGHFRPHSYAGYSNYESLLMVKANK